MALEASLQRSRIPPWRVVVAAVLAVGAIVGTLGYHDGAYDVDDLAAASEPGLYRFKGRLQAPEGGVDGFLLVDASGSRSVQWNVTKPEVGKHYVVQAELLEDGSLRGLAVAPVYVFTGRWF